MSYMRTGMGAAIPFLNTGIVNPALVKPKLPVTAAPATPITVQPLVLQPLVKYMPPAPEGMSTGKKLAIAGGVAGAGLLAFFAMKKR